MIRAEVCAGVCGHYATIEVIQLGDKHVQVVIDTDCEQVAAMNEDLSCIQWKGKGHEVFKTMTDSVVYQSAARHIRHTACVLPSAILKAIEVEVGVALPRDAEVRFVSSNDYTDPAMSKGEID